MVKSIKRCTPEEAGVPSSAVTAFLDRARSEGIELHSFMFLRHGMVFAEGWWKPYNPSALHPLYSFTKSFTSTAIGFAEQEGIISLDEKLVDIFPDEIPDNPSCNLKRSTIRNLLTMTCGHATEPQIAYDKDWLRKFFKHPFEHEPGSRFVYNSLGTTVLCAALRKKTGQSLTVFLKPRLLIPLGIKDFTCAKFPDGTEFGGGGGLLTTESMAKFMQFCLDCGKVNGTQLLNQTWFDRATSRQVETYQPEGRYPETSDWGQGYGFQFWRNTVEGSYRADGMFGQFGVVLPGHDMVAVITETSTTAYKTLALIWELLHDIVDDTPKTNPVHTAILKNKLDNLAVPGLWPSRSALESSVSGVKYEKQRGTRISLKAMKDIFNLGLPLKKGAMSLSLTFEDDAASLEIDEVSDHYTVKIGLQGKFLDTELFGTTYSAVGRWRSDSVFEAEIRPIETCGGLLLQFIYSDDKLTICREYTIPGMSKNPEIMSLSTYNA